MFICHFDMFEKDCAKYELEVKCINENSIDASFGEHFIVLYTKEYGQAGSTTLCSLLKYIANGTVDRSIQQCIFWHCYEGGLVNESA